MAERVHQEWTSHSKALRKATVQTHGKPFEISALRPFSMGKAAEETKGAKAQNEDFSEKTLRSLGGGAPSRC
jgi:hypothetical protein